MPQLADDAARLATDVDHPVYDCFHLAPAMRTSYPVVTADTRFRDEVRARPCSSDRALHVADTAPRRAARRTEGRP